MKMLKLFISLLLIATLYTLNNRILPERDQMPDIHLSGAFKAIERWAWERSYPSWNIPANRLIKAQQSMLDISSRGPINGDWSYIGPYNAAGRMLCMAFHPTDSEVVLAGSASGGLWKTETAGIGPDAWQEVRTGFPILAVSAIIISPDHPDTIFIGTGEVYSIYGNTAPGEVSRITRGTYGLGVFRSLDGGSTWEQSLSWELTDLTGIQDLDFDPQDHQTVFAATTEGLYRTRDLGTSWEQVHDLPNAVDIEIIQSPKKKIFVTHGNLNFNENSVPSGVFVSTDNAESFTQITSGLPSAYSGKALISPAPSQPSRLYASLQHWSLPFNQSTTTRGLYRSDNAGETWTRINNTNVAQFQGWYSHDVAVNPIDQDHIVHVGIDAWHSENGGDTLGRVSDWRLWTFGLLPNDGPDGPPNYVHADIHTAQFHPSLNGHIWLATDGGLFVSQDGGLTYESRNGGLHTTQFYAQMGNSPVDSLIAIGGAQDNSTYIRFGEKEWWRTIGGDGFSGYVHPEQEGLFYGSAQGLFLVRVNVPDDTIMIIAPPLSANDTPPFNGPFVIPPTRPDMLYAGAQHFYMSTNRGNSWTDVSEKPIDPGNFITHIAVDPADHRTIYAATSPNPFNQSTAKLLKSTDGGKSWITLTGLPDRVVREVAIDPDDPDVIYAVLSGFSTDHAFTSLDGGDSWISIGAGLPDLPTNTIIIDPLNTDDLYVGNDLGVYYSNDRGLTWTPLVEGLPEAIMVMDLSISPVNRKLRIASHGRGMFERTLVTEPVSASKKIDPAVASDFVLSPNPANKGTALHFQLHKHASITLSMITLNGQIVHHIKMELPPGKQAIPVGAIHSELPSGVYGVILRLDEGLYRSFLIVQNTE